jgi:hypothetical protein
MSRREQVESRLDDGPATVEKMMGAFSLDAVDHAAQQGIELDYSESSLTQVEVILGKLEADRPKGLVKLFRKGPSQSDVETIAKLYGGYIGEVMRFEWGLGEWIIPEDGPFAGALVLEYGEAMTSPPAKVFKRIVDGPGDDVWYYYQVLKQGVTERTPQ